MEDLTACAHCGATFVKKRRDSRHCSKPCQKRGLFSEWYALNRREPIPRSCPVCDEPIPSEAHANRTYCSTSCREVARRLTSYGLTLESYRQMLESQGHACAICGDADDNKWSRGGLRRDGWHIDHCHDTGKVRGILCPPCNLMIGYARDNVDTLRRAIDYLT